MTEQEFLNIWLQSEPAPRAEIEYRLYHDGDGFPLFYTTEDLPGAHVKVDKQTFLSGPKYIRVIDGKIVESQMCWTKKLVPGSQGQTCDPTDVSIVVDAAQPNTKWRLKHEDVKNAQ